jgi:K+-sensing histidine kinase KdpD
MPSLRVHIYDDCNVIGAPFVQPAGEMNISIALRGPNTLRRLRILGQGLAACAALAILSYAGFSCRFNLMTISFLYLLLVIAIALLYGFWQATLMSLLTVLCLDYLFLPPIFHFDLDDPMNWVALAEFELIALIVSGLSAKQLRNARESAIHRVGMEQLYELSRNSLLLDLSQAPRSVSTSLRQVA